jgi:hypothetical protein
MPKILEINGYKFFFFSNEGAPRERCHVHIRKGNSLAKYWIDPSVMLASSYGFSGKELNWLETCILENQDSLRRHWNEYFN